MTARLLITLGVILAVLLGAAAVYWWQPGVNIEFGWSTSPAAPATTTGSSVSPQPHSTPSPAPASTSPSSFATEPMIIGTTPVFASIADERKERIQGLSGVPSLQENEVKLFVFPHDDTWSFWMKDMNFSIDMIWVNASNTIVYIEEHVAPETFPQSFEPTTSARYVIETVAGFTKQHNIGVGDPVILPELLQ